MVLREEAPKMKTLCFAHSHSSRKDKREVLSKGSKDFRAWYNPLGNCPKQKIPPEITARMCCQCCENWKWSHFSNSTLLSHFLLLQKWLPLCCFNLWDDPTQLDLEFRSNFRSWGSRDNSSRCSVFWNSHHPQVIDT